MSDLTGPGIEPQISRAGCDVYITATPIFIFFCAGPLQLSLDKMFLDTIRFLFIFFVTFAGFAFAMTQLYWAWGKVRKLQCYVLKKTLKDFVQFSTEIGRILCYVTLAVSSFALFTPYIRIEVNDIYYQIFVVFNACTFSEEFNFL